MHAVLRLATGVRGHNREQGLRRNAEAHLRVFYVSWRLRGRGLILQAQFRSVWIAGLLRRIYHEDSRQEHNTHCGKQRPSLPRILHHLAERVSQARWNHEDEQHLQEIRERRWVLERMGGIRVKEAAAVGAQHLDGFLRSGGPLRDGLRAAFQRGYFVVRTEILNTTLRDQEQRS